MANSKMMDTPLRTYYGVRPGRYPAGTTLADMRKVRAMAPHFKGARSMIMNQYRNAGDMVAGERVVIYPNHKPPAHLL